MSESSIHKGGCYCRSVTYEVTGNPVLSAYCHCTMCQRLTGCPFIHTIHFPESAFKWTHERSDSVVLDLYSPPEKPWKNRYRCKECGACVASRNSKADRWSIWGAQLERDKDGMTKNWDVVKPTAHMFYDTRLVEVNDDLGKWDGYENLSKRLSDSVERP